MAWYCVRRLSFSRSRIRKADDYCSDTTLYPQNFFEEIKEWTAIFDYPATPISNVSESYLPAGYSNATYGPRFQAILAQGVGHTVPLFEELYLEFLGIA